MIICKIIKICTYSYQRIQQQFIPKYPSNFIGIPILVHDICYNGIVIGKDACYYYFRTYSFSAVKEKIMNK